MLIALRNSVHIWSGEESQVIDIALEENGYYLIDLNWEKFDLIPTDQDHFTESGFKSFCIDFVNNLSGLKGKRILILCDSTIDFWNYDENGNYTAYADGYLSMLLLKKDIRCVMDSVCGSGFVATPNFRSRLSNYDNNFFDVIIFVGGWNDYSHIETVTQSIRNTGRTARQKLIRKEDEILKLPDVGIEPTATGLKVLRSTI